MAFKGLKRDIEAQIGRQKGLQSIAESPFGLSPEQLNLLIEMLTQNLGAQKTQASGTLRQQTAGQPRSVRQSALAELENQFLGARQRGITQIQAGGIDRQLQALLALIQQDLARKQIQAQSNAALISSLANLGGSLGSLAIGGVKPKEQ